MATKQRSPDLDLLAQLEARGRRFVSSEEAAKVLGYTGLGLSRLRTRGSGPPYVPVHGGNNAPKLYPLDGLIEWLNQRAINSTAERARLEEGHC